MRLRKRASQAEIIAVNSLSMSLSKLTRACADVWHTIHTSSNALKITKELEDLTEIMYEVQERIDEVKEMHTINVRQRTLDLTQKFREQHGISDNIKKRDRE